MPASMKIFSLPKMATQSPRGALLDAVRESQEALSHAQRNMRELRKCLQRSAFLRY
jgi:hypothetical protein